MVNIAVFGDNFFAKNLAYKLAKDNSQFSVIFITHNRGPFLYRANVYCVYCNHFTEEIINNLLENVQIIIVCSSLSLATAENYFNYFAILPELISTFAKKNDIDLLIHISQIAIEQQNDEFARAKNLGKESIQSFSRSIVLNTNIIYGLSNILFSNITLLVERSKYIPVFCADYIAKPIVETDLINIINNILLSNYENYFGKYYNISGQEEYRWIEIYQLIARSLKRNSLRYIPLSYNESLFYINLIDNFIARILMNAIYDSSFQSFNSHYINYLGSLHNNINYQNDAMSFGYISNIEDSLFMLKEDKLF